MDDRYTYERSADIERELGRRAAESAKGDALGELYCEVCGEKRYGQNECPECGASRDQRMEAALDETELFPMSLAEAQQWVSDN